MQGTGSKTVLDRRQEHTEERRARIAVLNKKAAETEARIKRPYDAIETGIADLDDPDLKERIYQLKALRVMPRGQNQPASPPCSTARKRRQSRRICWNNLPRQRESTCANHQAATAVSTGGHSQPS